MPVLSGRRLRLPLIACCLLLAAACGSEPPVEGTAGDRDAVQLFNVSISAAPQSLDPQRATDVVSHTVLRNIYATFLRLDEHLRPQPDLAVEVPTVENGGISEDGLTYTFRLREGLTWSDGEPLVAQHFVDGAKRLFEPGSGNHYVDFYRMLAAEGYNEQVEAALAAGADPEEIAPLEREVAARLEVHAPDDRTVVYHLNRRSPVFLLLATMWPLYPVRQDVIDTHGERWAEPGTHVSNGPFILDSWTAGQELTLVRNEQYHGTAPHLQRVRFDVIDNSALAFLGYQRDELDAVLLGPAELVQVRQSEELRQEFRSYAQLSTIGVYFNLGHEPLQDVRVRQALAGGFDRVEYAEVVREGAFLPAYSWIPPGQPGFDDSAGRQYEDALERSRALMSDAGYGVTNRLEIELLTPQTSGSIALSEWLKAQWEEHLPVTVSIETLEVTAYIAERNAGNFQVVTGGWSADYPDPQNWLPQFRTGSALNASGFSDPEFDRLIDEAELELDNQRRLELYAEAQVLLLEQAPFAPLYHGRRNTLIKPWVRNLVTSSMEGEVPGALFLDRVYTDGRPE